MTCRVSQEKLEAPPGFEPGMEVLQTSALPLGDGAFRAELQVIGRLSVRPARGAGSRGCQPTQHVQARSNDRAGMLHAAVRVRSVIRDSRAARDLGSPPANAPVGAQEI